AVQAIFPRITMLDDQGCSARPGAYDDEKKVIEPPLKPGFYGGNATLRSQIEAFLIAYFNVYDAEDPIKSRKTLQEVYAENTSQFTMCLENLHEEGSGKTRWPNDNFSFHIRLSHNIKQIDKWSKNRQNRLFHGAMDVVSQLCKMPATRHLPDSFLIDVILATPSLLIFSVQGLLEEAPFALSPQSPQLNFFSRTFTVTPKSNGSFCVISDELFLSAMNEQRVQRYRLQLSKTNAAAAVAALQTATASVALADVNDEAATIARFCVDSGMVPAWAEMCLKEANWNYQVAGHIFLTAKQEGRIPSEAFPQ
ncbi:hypothetical protein PMAYCL1PPCAC_28925, partial [Pristionchus mayeri]